jgi:hypothetical protein
MRSRVIRSASAKYRGVKEALPMNQADEKLTAREAARKFTPQVTPNLQKIEKVSTQAPGASVQRAMKAKERLRGLV